MKLSTRKLLDSSFTGYGFFSIFLMICALIIIIFPLFYNGIQAFIFRGTIEYRRLMFEKFHRGNNKIIKKEVDQSKELLQPVFNTIANFEKNELKKFSYDKKSEYRKSLRELKKGLAKLFGPFPGEPVPVLWRNQYGQTRWDNAKKVLHEVLYIETWDFTDKSKMGVKKFVERKKQFEGTSLYDMFDYLKETTSEILKPRLTFYWRFLFDESHDAHFFGGIWPEILGTLYLTLGAMFFAIPMGVIAAIYLTEYAKPGVIVSFIRSCISTLAGVPSIVFGLFGLAFFINTVEISHSKSVLAGSLTLSLLILPTVIRASEEAIRSVPGTYKEAALSLGAGKWYSIITVILPAALPGILTGIVISMGRAAGETAPIIFTAAVSVGQPLKLWETFSQSTPALPWNIYNLCTEHEAVDEIRHVQYGMVLTLISIVLLLNMTAIIIRARISKNLKGS
ncbi:MAG: phosphate ABC transporter permease PstA [Chitinispirillia bacterium]